MLSPLDVNEAPPWLADSYERLALVSHRRHLAGLDADDATTLVIATDWLLWQVCLRERLHALHFEHLLGTPIAERGPVPQLVLRAAEWVYDGDNDVTTFDGVSLGQVQARQSLLATQAYERLWYGLDRLCRRYRPRRIALFDLRGDLDMVDDGQKRQIAADLARQHGAVLEDCFDPVAAGDPDFPNPVVFRPVADDWRRRLLRQAYARLVGLAFHLCWIWHGRKPKVLMLLDSHQLAGMMRGQPAQTTIAPVIDAGAVSKNWAFLRQAWRRGFILAFCPDGGLGRDDQARLRSIKQALECRWAAIAPDSPIEYARRGAARAFIAQGVLEDNARLVRRFKPLLERHRFARVLVADCDHAGGRVVTELAARRGIPVDESFNGILITDWQTPSRCGDGRKQAALARVLAWGEWGRSWLAAINSSVDMTVVGYPSIDTISAAPVNRGPGRRALLLPLYSIENDPGSLTGRVGDHLIAMIRMLRRQGFDGIRVKVHPGHANSGWYRAVLDQFGFAAVEVYCGGSIRCHAEWADIVIGPPTTGAMAECLALGRPYYAHVALPSGISTHHIPFVRMFTSAGELERALAAGWAPDCAAVLGDLCGGHGASARLWRALESQVSQSGDLPAQHPGKLQGRSTPG